MQRVSKGDAISGLPSISFVHWKPSPATFRSVNLCDHASPIAR